MSSDSCASLQALQNVIKQLVGPDGCPWDKDQTPLSLADYIIEESHELVAAIRSGKASAVMDEMGDLLFLLIFVATLFEKSNEFTLADALNGSSDKMIRRHPHVFGEGQFKNSEEHLRNWENIKKREHREAGDDPGLFASLPESLPPLVKAYRIHSKAARAGFTWPTDEEVEQQVESEWLEWLDVAQSDNLPAQKHELGDILFSLVEIGRRKGIKASEALDFACRRFLRRYSRMEELARTNGQELSDLSLDEKDELWNEAKAEEQGQE